MKIGIGLAGGGDPGRAAAQAVRQALRAVPHPSLAMAFGGVRLDQRKIHAALCRVLDPAILIGGSSYAEITPAGVTKDSVAVLLLELPGANFRFASAPRALDPVKAGERIAAAVGRRGDRCPVGFVFSGLSDGRDNELLRTLQTRLPGIPFFGGLASGDHGAGMAAPAFWRTWQYAGGTLSQSAASLALMDLPESARVGFGCEHGWRPVGPVARVSKAAASGLIFRLAQDAAKLPILRWRWRVSHSLAKGDEKTKAGDDYAARIYVTFRYDPSKVGAGAQIKYGFAKTFYGEHPPHAGINYIWANRLPKGESTPNPYTDRVMMVAVHSGDGEAGKWIADERNILEDYRKLFKEDPPPLAGIAVMTDTDNTGSQAEAWYADIELRSAP
ncbi:MAG TPA: hypothetical protein DCZ01_07775 [Elusimicrobia bacterium]|nr:MAG: hypothetical protein A2X37_01250 [Elusimicrobia bacterium GWA2_66_18]OGR75978.1 MAG: hypothetical protein A2X40_08530 [Elusimicrobia bacterium GWC2_65_9]HAZ08403.1 hypothetical protein [Elusimicrobiota bacterium]